MADQQPELSSSSNQLIGPPTDWDINNLLADISHELREEDLEETKLRFQGIIDRDVRNWTDAFQILKEERYISEDNLIYLQHIIRRLNRRDLLEKTIEYATNHRERVLHFQPIPIEIQPGHRSVRFHVKGVGDQTTAQLNTMRRTISQILSVPPEEVVFAGIQETYSLYIILTLPVIYVETLEKFLEDKTKHRILRPLFQLGIDRIQISETTFELEPGEETQRSDDKSDKIGIINKLQQEQLEEEIPSQRKYTVSNTIKQTDGKTSTRKRKQMPDLKESGNKRSNVKKEGSFIHGLRVSPRRSKIVTK